MPLFNIDIRPKFSFGIQQTKNYLLNFTMNSTIYHRISPYDEKLGDFGKISPNII